jgi:transposase InsO family protein
MVKDMTLTASNQAWAADITYIRTGKGFPYLSLLTDLWSRKIAGFNAGDTLEAEGAVRALETALKELPAGVFPVHHSDRGCQYCSRRYVEKLAGRRLPVSMTEETHCYENARAERLNGILKQEYGLGCSFRDKGQALDAIKEAVFCTTPKAAHKSDSQPPHPFPLGRGTTGEHGPPPFQSRRQWSMVRVHHGHCSHPGNLCASYGIGQLWNPHGGDY